MEQPAAVTVLAFLTRVTRPTLLGLIQDELAADQALADCRSQVPRLSIELIQAPPHTVNWKVEHPPCPAEVATAIDRAVKSLQRRYIVDMVGMAPSMPQP